MIPVNIVENRGDMNINKSSLLDMIVSLEHYTEHLREVIHFQHPSIEDTPERNDLVVSTWLIEKLNKVYIEGDHYELDEKEWDCLIQSLEVHIWILNYSTYENPIRDRETRIVIDNINKAHQLKKQLQNL